MGYWTGDILIPGAKIVQLDNLIALDLKYFVLNC